MNGTPTLGMQLGNIEDFNGGGSVDDGPEVWCDICGKPEALCDCFTVLTEQGGWEPGDVLDVLEDVGHDD